MKNYFLTTFTLIKQALLDDIVNRYLFALTFALSLIDWIIWRSFLTSPDLYVFIKIGYYPVKLLAFLLIINGSLAVFSYVKEKEISYLLWMGSLFLSVLVFALEIFYLTQY